MKINNIQNFGSFKTLLNKKESKKLPLQQKEQNYSQYPYNKNYLAFLGGKSLDLKWIATDIKEEDFPQGMYELVQNSLKENSNKSLYDIHFERYKGVLDCYSLEELKEKYPEFSEVISANDVEAKEESFIGVFQNGESEIFAQNEDLSLQLIKLYWGKGLSLNGLSDYIAKNSSNNQGVQLAYTMNKLNIPVMSKRYASVLRLSDKEYNEKFTSSLSKKIKEANEAREQIVQGEPVVILKGELSESHRKHISESLIKHYQEHPEKIHRLSQRQKDFYERYPEEREKRRQVMLHAWNETEEGKQIKKVLDKFIKKYTKKTVDEFLASEDEKDKNVLDKFWEKNQHLKSKMSEAVKEGWKWVKFDVETFLNENIVNSRRILFRSAPLLIEDTIRSWAIKNGYANLLTKHSISLSQCTGEDVPKGVETFYAEKEKLYDAFISVNPHVADTLASIKQHLIVAIYNDLEKNSPELPESVKNNEIARLFLSACMKEIFKEFPLFTIDENGQKEIITGLDMADISGVSQCLMDCAIRLECYDFGQYWNKKIDKIEVYRRNNNTKRLNAMIN